MKIYDDIEQGSAKWLQLRLGKPTASIIKDLKGGKTRQGKIYELASELLTGKPTPTFVSEDMRRGTFLEDAALQAFVEQTGIELETVGFVTGDDPRIGCSPDALVPNDE